MKKLLTMRTLFILASVMFVPFLAAPNKVEAQKSKATIPAESTVNTYLRNRVTSESGGALSLAGFRKTNGYEQGYGIYVIEWQAEILFEQEGYKAGDFVVGYWRDFRVLRQKPGTLDSLIVGNTILFNKGTTVRLTGNATLRNTEQGWRIEGFEVKTSQVLASQGIGRLYVPPDGEFSYNPPNGWDLKEIAGLKFKVAVLVSPNFSPNIVILENSLSGTLDDFVTTILRDDSSKGKNVGFRALNQSTFISNSGQRGVRVLTEYYMGQERMRATDYFFDGKNGKGYRFVCTPSPQGGEAFDKIFDESMKTFKSPASPEL